MVAITVWVKILKGSGHLKTNFKRRQRAEDMSKDWRKGMSEKSKENKEGGRSIPSRWDKGLPLDRGDRCGP